MKRLMAFVMTLVMVLAITPAPVSGESEVLTVADQNDYRFNILEISPTKGDFVLSQSDFGSNVKLYQYSIREYNAIREDLLGKYDIIYLGNGNSSGELYYTLGGPVNKLPSGNKTNGSLIQHYDASTPVYEYWPGNDATELVLGYFTDILNAGQVIVADTKLKDFSASNARMYQYVQDHQSQMQLVARTGASTYIQSLTSYTEYSKIGTPRPYFEITAHPPYYDGTEATLIDSTEGTTVNFDFKVMGYETESTYDIRFYFDLNGDLKYKEDDMEMLKQRTNVASTETSSLSISVPEDFVGMQPFKLEVEDKNTGAINSVTGYMAFKGDKPITINVLQVACNGNTFDLSTDFVEENNKNLLTAFSDDYVIDVDVITMTEYHALYNDPNFKLTEYENADGNGYNMLIFGFADIYGGADITDKDMADDLKDFINTGQSVMFTHDNLTFRVDQSGGWSRGLTRYFRDFVGQNIYWEEDYPRAGYVTLGFSDMAFERANGQGFKTTQDVYAFNDGLITNYPFALNDGGLDNLYEQSYSERILKVATTHYQYYQLDLDNEDVVVWYTLAGSDARNDYRDPANYYYTYSIGNVTYSGTGHTNLENAKSYEERKLFVNTIIKAVRGANFAPKVTIQGVSDGDEVARYTSALSFAIRAEDPDINDQYLGGKVYLDRDNDGDFDSDELVYTYDIADHTTGPNAALENGIFRNVVVDLTTVESDAAAFSIKVVATDIGGASGSKIYRFPIVDSPAISVSINAPGGALIGDTVTVQTSAELNVPDLSIEALIKDITIESSIHDDSDHLVVYPVTDTSDFAIGGYSGDYSVVGDVLRTSLADIANPTPGTIGQNIGTWSYTFEAKDNDTYGGDFYLQSKLNYRLQTYGTDEERTSGQSFEVKRGRLDFRLYDEFGADVNKDITSELYYFSSVADPSDPDFDSGTKVYDVVIENGAVTLGSDSTLDLKTGYYALKTAGENGYGASHSEAVRLSYSNHSEVVELSLPIQPVSDLKWVHEGDATPGALLVIDEGTSAISELRFMTYRDMVAFQLDYHDSDGVRDMNMSLVSASVELPDTSVVDVTGSFNVTSGAFQWTGAAMPEGYYIVTLTHNYPLGTGAGVLEQYLIDGDPDGDNTEVPNLTVTIEDTDGNDVVKTYTFNDTALNFMSAIDIY